MSHFRTMISLRVRFSLGFKSQHVLHYTPGIHKDEWKTVPDSTCRTTWLDDKSSILNFPEPILKDIPDYHNKKAEVHLRISDSRRDF